MRKFTLRHYNRCRSSVVAWYRRNSPFQYSWELATAQTAFLLLSINWLVWTPRPNYSIVLVGVIAAIMAARTGTGRVERILWIAAIISFSVCELRAVRVDTENRDKELIEARNRQDVKFAEVMENNQKAFNTTMGQLSSLAKQSAENLNAMTGGNGYASLKFVGPLTAPSPLVKVHSDYPLYDVHITIIDSRTLEAATLTAENGSLTKEGANRLLGGMVNCT